MIGRPAFVACLLVLCGVVQARPQDPPVVAGLHHAGLDRTGIDRGGIDARLRGSVLLGELGCAACHEPGKRGDAISSRTAPNLVGAGGRIHPDYLRAFIADPRRVKPGTTMPNMLDGLEDRAAAAEALTHYLVSLGGESFSPQRLDRIAAQRGKELFHTIGCVACHASRDDNGKERSLAGSVPLGALHHKYSVKSLIAFLEAPHRVRPSGRMPTFKFAPQEVFDLSNYLLADVVGPAEPFRPLQVDAGKAGRGKELFSQLDCVRCHAIDGVRARKEHAAMQGLDAARGCLSGTPGNWPHYPLSTSQKKDIAAALAAPDFVPSAEQEIRKALVTLNCVACHQRGELGGISEQRDDYFQTEDLNLGESSRIPPPLTGVGAKLKKKWLADTMAYGQSIRPYMKTRMPGFGKDSTARLAELLAGTDKLEPVQFAPLPKDNKAARVIIDLGQKLVGDKGLNCIACHTFRGVSASAMAAVDLVDTTGERLQRDWFYHYMMNPIRFRRETIMPRFFLDGVSTRKEIVDGDPKRQIEAMWHYLAKGRNTRQPSGMVRPSMEIVVGDQAVILRRSAQDTGKRAISVGLPGKVSYTFDAESIGLNQIWWGRFIDPVGVWTGQGSGQVRIMERERAKLPKGPAFVILADATSPWPESSRRDLGHRFAGYQLDTKQRPILQYECEGVSITDAPIDVTNESGGLAILRRTFRFTNTDTKDKVLYFRAAVDKDIEDFGRRTARVGRSLHIRFAVDGWKIRDAGATKELIVPVPIRGGRAELVIDYIWQGRTK